MKHLAACLIILASLLQACEPLPSSPSSTRVTSTRPPSTETAPASTTRTDKIPLPIGHASDGGWYQLYFTDPANPDSDQLTGGPDGALVDAIDAARLSVDMAVYSFSLNSIRRALLRAHRRGVRVRVVMESDNLDRADPQALKDAGIPIIGDRREGLMHDKFLIIDRSEVWTGSMNMTGDGAYADRNNLLLIRSAPVAQDYETEFEEMFSADKFGPDTSGPTPHPHVTINGTPLDIYFSPDDHPARALVDLVNAAHSSVYFLAYSFTSDPLGEALRQRAAAGLTVQGVMDSDQVQFNQGSEFDAFQLAGLDVRLDGEPGLLHDKLMIIDGATVVTGSYNFTASAEKYNDENVLVIHDPTIAALYMKEFLRVQALSQP